MAKSFPNTGVSIIDASADLPGSPVEGLMVFQKDTNELKIYDGSAWRSMLDTDTPPGMTLVQPTSVSGCTVSNGEITASSTTSMTVNGVFSSAFDMYKIVHYMFTGSSSVTNTLFQLTAGGTANTSNYFSRMWYYSQGGGGFTTATANSGSSLDWMFYGGNVGGGGELTLYRPYNTYNTTMSWSQSMWTTTDNAAFFGHSLHYYNGQMDGFKLTSTTAISGTFRVYGLRNSV